MTPDAREKRIAFLLAEHVRDAIQDGLDLPRVFSIMPIELPEDAVGRVRFDFANVNDDRRPSEGILHHPVHQIGRRHIRHGHIPALLSLLLRGEHQGDFHPGLCHLSHPISGLLNQLMSCRHPMDKLFAVDLIVSRVQVRPELRTRGLSAEHAQVFHFVWPEALARLLGFLERKREYVPVCENLHAVDEFLTAMLREVHDDLADIFETTDHVVDIQ